MQLTENIYLEINGAECTAEVLFNCYTEDDGLKIHYDISVSEVISVMDDETTEELEINNIYEILEEWLDKPKNYKKLKNKFVSDGD